MLIASWNVNSLTARLPRVLAWLESSRPDVLLVQETKCADAAFPAEALAGMGYQSAHHGDGRWNGVAIISRVGIAEVVRGLDTPAPTGLPEPRFLSANCGGMRVASVYVPNGREIGHPYFSYKLAWLQELGEVVARDLTKGELVVGGDFNVAPTDQDVFDPEAFIGATHVTVEERGVTGGDRQGTGGSGDHRPESRLHVLGLPSGLLPQGPWNAHRPASGKPSHRISRHQTLGGPSGTGR